MSRNPFKGTRILVVGGAGFVGSNLVKALLRQKPARITVVDNLLSAERVNMPESRVVRFVQGSITDDRVLRRLKDDLDYVFHLATFHGNQNSMADPLGDHENNTLTTLKLFLRLRGFRKLRKVVYASAGCTVARKTYGEARATREDDPVSLFLDSPYQISKIIGEFYANYFFKQDGLPVVKARFQNVYGPGEILGAGRWRGTAATVWRNVTPVFVYKALKGFPLPVEGRGEATRDFIYVDDIVRGLMLCAVRGDPGGVYNLASGKETSILELAQTINRLAGSRSSIQSLPRRSWDKSGKRYGSTAKARRELGFVPRVTLKRGLQLTLAWTRDHGAVIDRCIRKHKKHLAP